MYNYVKIKRSESKGTAASLGIYEMKTLVKMMKQVKVTKLMIMRFMSVPGYRLN